MRKRTTFKNLKKKKKKKKRSIDNKSDDGLEENRQLEVSMHTFMVMAERSS